MCVVFTFFFSEDLALFDSIDDRHYCTLLPDGYSNTLFVFYTCFILGFDARLTTPVYILDIVYPGT